MSDFTKGINLLPTLTKQEIRKEKKKGQLILGTTGVTFIASLITAGLLFYNLFLQYKVNGAPFDFLNMTGISSEISTLNQEIDDNEDILTLYTEVGTKIEFIDNILISRLDYKYVLDMLEDILPEDIEISEYKINENGEIELTGVALDYYTLALFVKDSQEEDLVNGYLENIVLGNADKVDDEVSFSINANVILPESVENTSGTEVLGAYTKIQ